MLTYDDIVDQVLLRFKSALRTNAKEWARAAYQEIWGLEDWTFRYGETLVTVTANSSTVTGTPALLGVPIGLVSDLGEPLQYLEPPEFARRYYGDTGTDTPEAYTRIGETLYVGPIASATSAAYKLLHERALGYYLSTTSSGSHSLPAATINVASTTGFPSAGTLQVFGETVTYTGKTGTSFTGCTGGTRVLPTGSLILAGSPSAGDLVNDTDVPLLPGNTHIAIVLRAQAIGQALEGDPRAAGSDASYDRVIEGMRREYLAPVRGESQQWGADPAALASGLASGW